MGERTLTRIVHGLPTSDGAGVRLRRTLGQSQALRLDPFLMLDEFSSEDAADYIGGFPDHPHRGFETVTYMLDGHMLHEDHLGNRGDLRAGDVQWMTAARGIIHSEMPQQKEGRMRGFQLWINLPAREKMKPAAYRDIPAAEMPLHELAEGIHLKVIAGEIRLDNVSYRGPIVGLSTEPLYLDITLAAGKSLEVPLPEEHNAFVYVYEGDAAVAGQRVPTHSAGLLSTGETLTVQGGAAGARFLLLAGRPLGEPVVQYGPFVMNTVEEIDQALRDYRDGTLTEPAA